MLNLTHESNTNQTYNKNPAQLFLFLIVADVSGMDAPEADVDIKLQKVSADLLEDFDRSLPHLLWKPDGHGGTVVRSRVRAKEIFRLTNSVSKSEKLICTVVTDTIVRFWTNFKNSLSYWTPTSQNGFPSWPRCF
jgi:hypothetical protein